MTHTFTISYMDCQTCRTRIHIDKSIGLRIVL